MRCRRLIYASQYNRGLLHLLGMWGTIRAVVTDATLDIAYGWEVCESAKHLHERAKRWREGMEALFRQEGVCHHGRLGQAELTALRQRAGIWAYPTDFCEINCITALEMQHDGVVPVVINRAALRETVWSGVRIEGDITTPAIWHRYVQALISLIVDPRRWAQESDRARARSMSFGWASIAQAWVQVMTDATAHEPELAPFSDPTAGQVFPDFQPACCSKQAEATSLRVRPPGEP